MHELYSPVKFENVQWNLTVNCSANMCILYLHVCALFPLNNTLYPTYFWQFCHFQWRITTSNRCVYCLHWRTFSRHTQRHARQNVPIDVWRSKRNVALQVYPFLWSFVYDLQVSSCPFKCTVVICLLLYKYILYLYQFGQFLLLSVVLKWQLPHLQFEISMVHFANIR